MRASHLAAVAVAVIGGASASARAQPIDPYAPPAPTPAPTPTPAPAPGPAPVDPYGDPAASGDHEIDDAVADALVTRAQGLAADGAYADAKQLVVEALMRDPQGPRAAEARALLAELNKQLGIQDAPPPTPIKPPDQTPPADTHVDQFLTPTQNETPKRPSRGKGLRYGGGLVLGATAGGLFADVMKIDGTTPGEVMGGAVLGGAAGLLAAHYLGGPSLTAGDYALVDSLSTWGLVAGLALGEVMQPPTGEAYSMNGVIGIVGGYAIGEIAARKTDVSARRMVRVDAVALAGAAVPWVLYGLSRDSSTHADEQAFGVLSTAGLIAGAWLGFRWTRHMHADSDAAAPAGPTALFQHDPHGWAVGGLGLRRVQGSTGATMSLISGAW